ncbi:hypothetical protein [Kineosporia sp. NBRC 101731]|uniref:hypothetical protein n=1 Tax=Kineosporia sp. NBRC 101731 TaxID=3032199 RepID=UPI0024A1913B|nr:hypothetical protein [Kineosporia sp. NBRC 101731]GLY32260.1 hypothetical protein Kisp02_56250 [Kineosporia sp. NBRC 101731]
MLKTIGRFCLVSALAATALFASTESAHADGCDWKSPCGEVQNDTPWGMYITTSLGRGSDWCDVWNSNAGSSGAWKHMKCTQEYLAPGKHRGGGNVDVDAFTFSNRAYYMTYSSKSWHDKGVWTKITDLQEGKCDDRNGVPTCWIN